MAITVTASVLTMSAPASTQVVVAGLTVGQSYLVTGLSGAFSWPVPGGVSTALGASVVLVDNRAPINGPITYQAVVAGTTYTSGSVTVSAPGMTTVLQSLSGGTKVPVNVSSVADDRSFTARVVAHPVAGRERPPTRYDSWTAEVGKLTIDADGPTTVALKTLLKPGAPVIRRSTVGLLDIPPSELIQITGTPGNLLYSQVVAQRDWTFTFLVIDDPEPSVPVTAFTWDNFDTIYATFTWATWDTEWAPQTWDKFDRYNFGQRL